VWESLAVVDEDVNSAAGIERVVGDDRLVHPHACTECGLMFWRCVEFPGGTVLCSGCLYHGLGAALGVGGP
jgi:hypothetical protein